MVILATSLLALAVAACLAARAPLEPPVREQVRCNGLRCKEANKTATAVCGVWDNELFIFQDLCDMYWFGCMTDRKYTAEQLDYCENPGGPRPTRPPATHEPTRTTVWTTIATTTAAPTTLAYITPGQDMSLNWNPNVNNNNNQNYQAEGYMPAVQNIGGFLSPGHPGFPVPPSYSQVEVGYVVGSWDNQS